jgi:hypothetical protein
MKDTASQESGLNNQVKKLLPLHEGMPSCLRPGLKANIKQLENVIQEEKYGR